jgi:Transposase.
MGNHGKRYSEEQIIAALKEAQSGISVNDICRKYGVSAASYYKWKAKYSGMSSTDLRRSRELELENRRLRKAVADLTLDIQVLKDVNSKNW